LNDSSSYADFPEMAELYRCKELLSSLNHSWSRERINAAMNIEGWIHDRGRSFPLASFEFGNRDPSFPVLVIVGGIHGLEKIGTQIILSYLRSWIRLLQWDQTLVKSLDDCRVVFYPIANPAGMLRNWRSNAAGIDLMRHAPIEADAGVYPLVGGHRLSPRMPWYRGPERSGGEEEMEAEARVLADFIRRQCFRSRQSIVLDVHSGFGWIDRVWFPFASSRKPFPDASNVLALKQLLDRSYPHHVYKIEPQNHSYMTHGDLWDYLYLDHQRLKSGNVFLPLCLEMGSWPWIKKNPKQLLSSSGFFNPTLPHRVKRAERRHFLLFNFLLKAIASGESWDLHDVQKKAFFEEQALRLWYSN
jgi:hypothetical protein